MDHVDCTKKRYRDRIGATIALMKAQANQDHSNYAVGSKRRETRIYKCPKCHGWHLTSLS